MDYFINLGYSGLFISAFLSATLLPLGSEIVLTTLQLNNLPAIPLVIIATIGNVLGSLTNYALGYWASLDTVRKYLGITEQAFLRAKQRFAKYGVFSLCFAWLPIIGDPLTLAAGILRIRLLWFLLLVTAGKLTRYIVISYLITVNI